MKITENSTIKELLDLINDLEEQAGAACMASEGTQGCNEASAMQFLYTEIKNLISNSTPNDHQ